MSLNNAVPAMSLFLLDNIIDRIDGKCKIKILSVNVPLFFTSGIHIEYEIDFALVIKTINTVYKPTIKIFGN